MCNIRNTPLPKIWGDVCSKFGCGAAFSFFSYYESGFNVRKIEISNLVTLIFEAKFCVVAGLSGGAKKWRKEDSKTWSLNGYLV